MRGAWWVRMSKEFIKANLTMDGPRLLRMLRIARLRASGIDSPSIMASSISFCFYSVVCGY
jgi:hypothetical protein